MKSKIISCAMLLGVLCAVSCRNNGVETQNQAISFKSDSVFVDPTSSVASHLQISEITRQPFMNEFRTVGTANAPTGQFAKVVLPFDGRITKSLVNLGQRVRAGQPLFEMYSAEFNDLVRDFWQALRSSEKMDADYARKKVLYEGGVISQREYEELYAEAENARREMEGAASALKIYNVDLSKVQVGQPVTILAPIAGEVVQNSITVGQYVKSDEESPITIADLSSMWVTALVKEAYIGNVSKDEQAEIFIGSDTTHPIEARIINVGDIVDEQTRSIQVTLSCSNAEKKLKHGMFVSVHFMSEEQDQIVVPSTAVFQGEQMNYVFTASSKEGVYLRRKVEVGSTNDDNTRISILSGIEEGDMVITNGGIYLAE